MCTMHTTTDHPHRLSQSMCPAHQMLMLIPSLRGCYPGSVRLWEIRTVRAKTKMPQQEEVEEEEELAELRAT